MQNNDAESCTGLPNLPKLSRYWNVSTTFPSLDPVEFTFVLPADPTRWSVEFISFGAVSFLVTGQPDSPPSRGYDINNNGSRLFQYKDQGPYIQQAWYVFGKGSATGVQIVDVCIRDLRAVQQMNRIAHIFNRG